MALFVLSLPFWNFRGCRGFCHRTESDLLLFVLAPGRLSNASLWQHFDPQAKDIAMDATGSDNVNVPLEIGSEWVGGYTSRDMSRLQLKDPNISVILRHMLDRGARPERDEMAATVLQPGTCAASQAGDTDSFRATYDVQTPFRIADLRWGEVNGCLTSQLRYFSHICDGTQMCRRTEEEVGPTVGLPTPLTFRRVL